MFINNISADKSSMMQVAQQRNLNNNKAGNEGGAVGANNGLEPFILDISQQGKDKLSTEMRDKLQALNKTEKVQSSNVIVQTLADGLGKVQESLEEMRSLTKLASEDDSLVTDEDRAMIQQEIDKIKAKIPEQLGTLGGDLADAMPTERVGEFLAYLAKQQDPATNVVSPTEKFEKNLQDHLQEVYAIDVSSKQNAKAGLDAIDGAVSKIIKIKEELGYDKDGNFIKDKDKTLYADPDKAETLIGRAIRAVFDRHHTIAA